MKDSAILEIEKCLESRDTKRARVLIDEADKLPECKKLHLLGLALMIEGSWQDAQKVMSDAATSALNRREALDLTILSDAVFSAIKADNPIAGVLIYEALPNDSTPTISLMLNAALAYEKTGDFSKAELLHENLVRNQPKDLRILFNYANFLTLQSRVYEAAEIYKFLVTEVPDSTEPKICLANCLIKLSKLDDAKLHIDTLKALTKDEPRVSMLEALYYYERGDLAKAEAIRQKIPAQTDLERDFHIQCARTCAKKQNFDCALSICRWGTQLDNSDLFLSEWLLLLMALHRIETARALIAGAASASKPYSPSLMLINAELAAYCGSAAEARKLYLQVFKGALNITLKLDAAIGLARLENRNRSHDRDVTDVYRFLDKNILIGSPDIICSYSIILSTRGRVTAAIDHLNLLYKRGLLKLRHQTDLLYLKMKALDFSEQQVLLASVIAESRKNPADSNPFVLMARSDDLNLLRLSARAVCSRIPALPPENTVKSKGQRVRVAYISSDFRGHPISTLILPILRHQSQLPLTLCTVFIGDFSSDQKTDSIRELVEEFHDFRGIGPSELYRKIRNLNFDICIDLNGYTEGGKPEIWKWRICPIQIGWLGYLGTSGGLWDYLVADETTIPSTDSQYYDERIIRLPIFQPIIDHMLVDQASKTSDYFTYCCLNNSYKLSENQILLFARILKGSEKTRLIIYASDEVAERNLTQMLQKHYSSLMNRVTLVHRQDYETYLRTIQSSDLFLDTWPYGAGTTAADALGLGVPVLTRIGMSMSSRMCASHLKFRGLEGLITTSEEEFVEKAIECSKKPVWYTGTRLRLDRFRGIRGTDANRSLAHGLGETYLSLVSGGHERPTEVVAF